MGNVLKLKQLGEAEIVQAQRRGYFDEHLASLYSTAYGEPYLCDDKYLVYENSTSKTVSVTLFALDRDSGDQSERFNCFKDLVSHFKPSRVIVSSPVELPSPIGDYVCEKVYQDRDYQIFLRRFDADLAGREYKSLRYRLNHARRCGYSLVSGKVFTPAHMSILARFLAKSKNYELWDYQLYLGLSQYISRFASSRFFDVFSGGLLIGFDVVDALSDVLCVPLGFYLDYPSIGDFLIYKEILYAKEQGFEWLDIGWACNAAGLEEFKVKWGAVPRFEVCMQVFAKIGAASLI